MHLTIKKSEAAAAKGIFFKDVFNRTTEMKLPSREWMALLKEARKQTVFSWTEVGESQLGVGAGKASKKCAEGPAF